jgi:Zinc finger, C2H2 type
MSYFNHIDQKTCCLDTSSHKETICHDLKCLYCDKLFTRKDNLGRHMTHFCKNKTEDNTISMIEENKENAYKCNYCDYIFTRKDSLKKHILSRCKIKKDQDNLKEQLFNELITEINNLKKEIKLIRQQKNPTNINHGNINNGSIINHITNNIINIKLNAFGKEDRSHITNEDYKRIINKGFKSIPELIKLIHFDENKPENQNIYISNMRDNYVMIYDGKKWVLGNKKDTIHQLYMEKKDILVDKYDELINELPEYAITKFNRFLHTQTDDKIANQIKDELKLMLYNNKKIPTETKEKLGLLLMN